MTIEVASEFRYGEVPMTPGGLTIVVSQSGETADTLASLRYAKANGQAILSVVNVATSTMARESDVTAPTLAGPEIGVASTKAFTCQLAVLACLALAFGRARGTLSAADETRLVADLMAVPGLMAEALKREAAVEALSHQLGKVRRRSLSRTRHVVSAGARGRAEAQGIILHPCRRLCRRRTEARPDRADRRGHAGHRHRARGRRSTRRPSPTCRRSRRAGGRLIMLGDSRVERDFAGEAAAQIILTDMAPDFTAMVYAVPVQMIAYHTAVFTGKDADQPRNLAKSVTVE